MVIWTFPTLLACHPKTLICVQKSRIAKLPCNHYSLASVNPTMSEATHIENGLPPRKIVEVAKEIGLDPEEILLHGHYIAKIPVSELHKRANKPDGVLVLVTAMNPTPFGEGKTSTTIGLSDALRRLGYRTMFCLREPSLGPYFGIKGGGTGGGKSQVVPAEDINLHFVGDMYAVEKANNLLCTLVDNHLQHGNELRIDPRRIVIKRVIDLNDRSLRDIIIGLGGPRHGVPRRDGFNITPASEVMAILCLVSNFTELGERLSKIVVGYTYEGQPVLAEQLQAVGAMQVLLRDAIHPNLVQTLEGTPGFVHCGPFANIAQGTNSAVATKLALKLSEFVVTEAGFGTDLGAEKFFHIKCRFTGLKPAVAVIVATVRAIKHHGGFTPDGGLGNLAKHLENIRSFGVEPVVAINRFETDTSAELRQITKFCEKLEVPAVVTEHYTRGGEGAIDLARTVVEVAKRRRTKNLKFLYRLDQPLQEKIEIIAKSIYGADGVDFDRGALEDLEQIQKHGYDKLAVCVAKTPLSLSDNPKLVGRPKNFRIRVNELRVSAGAGFVVAICGNIVTMPGLPKVPAAVKIKVLPDGRAIGLH